jgi:hypothetical protein
MRGNAKVMRVPTTLARKVRLPQDAGIKGVSELLHSITPNERRKTTISYLKNSSPPTPVIRPTSDIVSDSSFSSYFHSSFVKPEQKGHEKNRFRLFSKGIQKRNQIGQAQSAMENFSNRGSDKDHDEKNFDFSPISFENLQNFNFLMMRSKIPVFREKSCFLMSKEEFENKLPRLKEIKKQKVKITKSLPL